MGLNVRIGPLADIRSISTYRTDFSRKAFYKQTPYRPVLFGIFLRACKKSLDCSDDWVSRPNDLVRLARDKCGRLVSTGKRN